MELPCKVKAVVRQSLHKNIRGIGRVRAVLPVCLSRRPSDHKPTGSHHRSCSSKYPRVRRENASHLASTKASSLPARCQLRPSSHLVNCKITHRLWAVCQQASLIRSSLANKTPRVSTVMARMAWVSSSSMVVACRGSSSLETTSKWLAHPVLVTR